MNKQKYIAKVKNILKEYGLTLDVDNSTKMETIFGKLNICVSKTPNRKFYSVYMRFVEDFNIDLFFKYFSKYENINPHSKKWNIHNSDVEFVLNELDSRINNLTQISSSFKKKYG